VSYYEANVSFFRTTIVYACWLFIVPRAGLLFYRVLNKLLNVIIDCLRGYRLTATLRLSQIKFYEVLNKR